VQPTRNYAASFESLIARSADGDEPAWDDLWHQVEPHLLRQLREHREGPLTVASDAEDLEVVRELKAQLEADHFHRLRHYLEARHKSPGLSFSVWLSALAKRAAVDHHGHVARGSAPEVISRRDASRVLLARAAAVVPASQRRPLELWLDGARADEIAIACGFEDAAAAERAIDAALAQARRALQDGD